MNTRERESKLRQDIRRRQDNLGALISRLHGGGPMIKGSVYIRKRLCGHPRCRCVRGQLHQDRVLAIRHKGQVALRRLDPVGDVATEEAVLAWRRFRRYRVELARACRGLIQAVDCLGRLRQIKTGGLK